LLMAVAVVATSYVIHVGLNSGGFDTPSSTFRLLLAVSHILTSVVPPEFPVTMSLTVTLALVHLAKASKIFCTEPFRIPLAGKTEICFFDKTGTLTSQKMKLEELVPEEGTEVMPEAILAVCHTVTRIDGNLVGDPIEVAGVEVVEAGKRRAVKIFHFDPSLQRMSVVTDDGYGFVKGSPEKIFALLKHTPSEEISNACKSLTQSGFRVLALAWRKTNIKIDRNLIESDLILAGLAAFSFTIKPHTKRTIELIKAAGIKCVMVTGDHPETSLFVAKATGIVSDDDPVAHSGDPTAALQSEQAESILVWSRCTPADKEKIVNFFAPNTLFCGDGTNDVGALKTASVGIAISNQEDPRDARRPMIDPMGGVSAVLSHASIAAPFVHRGSSVRSVLNVIRSGRTTLALTMQMYKILAVNSLVTAFCLSVLTVRGVKLGDTQTSVEAIYLSLLSFIVSRASPGKELERRDQMRESSVFSWDVLVSIFAQAGLHLGLLFWLQSDGVNEDILDLGIKKFSPSVSNTLAFIQLAAAHIGTMIANYAGAPALPRLISNRPVLFMLGFGLVFLAVLVSGELNDLVELVPLSSELTERLIAAVLAHVIGAWVIASLIRVTARRCS
jgi:manganese-transporting P-type ATPase